MVCGKYLTIVYTIGDELSFTEFIMVLRRILADHPDREDILDKHPKLLNLSSTGDHPVLAKQRARQPKRWLHIKLQVEDKEVACWTTLIMRDDNLYVCGFMNQQEVYGLVDNEKSEQMLPTKYCDKDVQRLEWTVHYKSILGAASQKEVVNKLDSAHLGKTFAEHAVDVLSRYSSGGTDRHGVRVRKDESSPRLHGSWMEQRHGIHQATDALRVGLLWEKIGGAAGVEECWVRPNATGTASY
jgi:hypothetical protein